MKKLFVVLTIVLMAAISYGQALETLNAVGSGPFNAGGDSKTAAYDKINLAIDRQNANGVITTIVTLDSTDITGSAAGSIGHTAGAPLVAAPGAGYALDFISAVMVFDFDSAAYTGGNDDATIRLGTIDVTPAFTDATYIGASNDSIYSVRPLATAALNVPENVSINLSGTAFTNPGGANGELRVHVTYRRITTGL